MKKVNPFKPTAGAEPPVLAGRDAVLSDFEIGLEEGVGAPGRLMRITGPRGSGKTVLLTELGDIARQHGWRVVDVTAAGHLPELICRRLEKEKRADYSVELDLKVIKARAQKDDSLKTEDIYEVLERVVGKLTEKGYGLLVTVDEIQDASIEDVREVAVAIQHLIRERRNIAFVFAGLTAGVMNLLGEDGPTFLRRAYPEELDTIPVDEVEAALGATFEKSEVLIGEEELSLAAHSTAGYAYLIQLVGYYVWRAAQVRAGAELDAITMGDVEKGVVAARREFERTVLETAIAHLPKRAMEYLLAMAEDKLASSTGEIANRLGVFASSLSTTRKLLVSRQVIESTARGYVGFSIPFMREYLVENRETLLARYGVEG
ncbi:AAA family ATPase [Enorma burkinafasonensis]|uniref:AAA family ATPase n=1 Tax=Enorma burkinafasonensis TaxID=2590867 RepID=UPI0026EEDF1A|nr:ATP-binding protein [Enorma burkinafasonensis]MCI7730884.1 ATP-binding protein [Enorma burkinafasonensis]